MKSLLIMLLLASGCAKVDASSNSTAVVIPAPIAGYACFAIVNSEGATVGGNCVLER